VIASLDGAYITGEDIGTLMSDMDIIAGRTPNVIGKSPEIGGAGDPSPTTARGVLGAIRVSLEALDGSPDLTGKRIGVVGVGKVGSSLAEQLAAAGAEVLVSDVDQERLQRTAAAAGARALSTPELLAEELDVLAPCSLGELIDDDVARSLRVRIVAGGANNPLAGDHVADILAAREILFVPDFISNCGGLIYVASEHYGFDAEAVERQLQEAHVRTGELLAEAKDTGETPLAIALRQVGQRVAAAAAAR
jgi:valine dehydrogenase (NAD+)